MGSFIQLPGSLCTLRPWRPADAEALVQYANNANVARNLRDRFPQPYTIRDANGFIHSCATARPHVSFAIEVNCEAVGGIGISPGTDVERFSAEIGYWLGEPFWGRGITAEAVQLMSAYAFSTCNLLRLFALPFAENRQSTRVLEKAGYTREAILRSSAVKDGAVRDQALYALVNPRWRVQGAAG
jgi:RimJ/RimL family protein N-acetyltransferase